MAIEYLLVTFPGSTVPDWWQMIGATACRPGAADAIRPSLGCSYPYNPFGIDLCSVASLTCGVGPRNDMANYFFGTRRPLHQLQNPWARMLERNVEIRQ